MKRLKRIAVSAVMAGTAAGIIAPVTAAGTMVNVMAQDSEDQVQITKGGGGRVESQDGIRLIQNATRYATMPESAKVGEIVHIQDGEPEWAKNYRENPEPGDTYLGFTEGYMIIRVSDGAWMPELMVNDNEFIMPDYDIKVITNTNVSGILYGDKTDVVADEIQWETEVFSIEGDPGVLNGITEAHEGETVRLQGIEGINRYIFEIFRKDNGEDITEQIDWIDKDSFYMPECDIQVTIGIFAGPLIDVVSTAGDDNSLAEGNIFNIVNESGADVVSVSPPGEEVFLRTPLPESLKEYIELGYENVSYNEDYSIIRIEDGVDVTDELLNPETNSFIMPEYDVKIITRIASSSVAPPKDMDNVLSQITDADGTVVDEEEWIENEKASEGEDKVLSQITDADGTVADEENAVDEKTEEGKTGIGMADDGTQNTSVNVAKTSVTAVGPTVKTVQSSGAAAATEAVASRIASSAPVTVAAAGTSAVTPVTTRRSGTNPTIVNTAPATGDATGSTAWIIAVAGAAVAAGAAAVTMVQKRKNEG